MAITAAVTLSSSTCTAPNGVVTAIVTVTNGNATDAIVTGIDLLVVPQNLTSRSVAVSTGVAYLGPGAVTTVTASGTLAKNISVQPFSPQPGGPSPGNPSTQVYTIGATVSTNATGADAVVNASTTNLTVSAPSH